MIKTPLTMMTSFWTNDEPKIYRTIKLSRNVREKSRSDFLKKAKKVPFLVFFSPVCPPFESPIFPEKGTLLLG